VRRARSVEARAARAARDAEAERLYRGGASLNSIGASLGVDIAHLSRILRARGVPMRPRGAPPTDEALRARCLRMISEGKPLGEIVAACGKSGSWVRWIAAQEGVPCCARRARLERLPERNAEVERLYRDGMSLRGIRDATGVDPGQAYRILRARGVPMRPRGRVPGPDARVRAALADVRLGTSLAEASTRHGVTIPTLRRYVCGPWL